MEGNQTEILPLLGKQRLVAHYHWKTILVKNDILNVRFFLMESIYGKTPEK